jgi:hypothetical protein
MKIVFVNMMLLVLFFSAEISFAEDDRVTARKACIDRCYRECYGPNSTCGGISMLMGCHPICRDRNTGRITIDELEAVIDIEEDKASVGSDDDLP